MEEKGIMEALTHGVYLIGAKDGEKINFMTAAWAAQLSANPKKITVAIGKTHYTAEMISKTGRFSLNVLKAGQEELAKRCGYTSGRSTDKSRGIEYVIEEDIPIVKNTAAYLQCRLIRSIDTGDHMLVIAEVTGGENYGEEPLIYDEKVYF